MASSDQLAREARATRERLNQTLDELRVRARPANVIDEITGFFQQATEPVLPDTAPRRSRYTLPLALVGAGLAWLALEARSAERARQERLARLAEAASAEAEAAAMVPPVPAVPEHGTSLAAVETVSIAPVTPTLDEENSNQRSLPL